jgi:hypothetical protein
VRFRGAEDERATRLGDGLCHLHASPTQVDATDPQRGHLSPTQSGVGQERDHIRVPAILSSEAGNLLVVQIPVAPLDDPRKAEVVARVPAQPTVTDGVLHLFSEPGGRK